MFNSFSDIEAQIIQKSHTTPTPLIVACPYSREELQSVHMAISAGLVQGWLVGETTTIADAAHGAQVDLSSMTLHEAKGDEEVARMAVRLAAQNPRAILLKGKISTPALLKAVLNREHGLRRGDLISDLFIYENPFQDQARRMICITDGGVNIAPDLNQKRAIIHNAVHTYRSFGQDCPHVALLSASEKPTSKMPSTTDAVALAEMARTGEFGECRLEGPFGFDNAVLKWCADLKGMASEVSGNLDIMVFPSIESANITAKAVCFYLKPKFGHVLVGARVPILINSRTDDAEARYHSILLAMAANQEVPS